MLNTNGYTFARHLRIIKQQLDFLATGLQETGLRSEHRQGKKNTRARRQEGIGALVVCGQSEQLQTNSQTLWFTVIIFQVLAITWHTGQTFIFFPNSCGKTASAAASVAPYWDDGWMPHRAPEATRKKRELHETDSSRLLQGVADDRGRFISDLHRWTASLHDAPNWRARASVLLRQTALHWPGLLSHNGFKT